MTAPFERYFVLILKVKNCISLMIYRIIKPKVLIMKFHDMQDEPENLCCLEY